MKIVTIHQPNFLPWLGFFNKINKADTWVILDHVENNPRDASFLGRRVKFIINKEAKWVSVPLKKPEEKEVIGVPINYLQINTSIPKLLEKTKRSIEQSYSKSLHFNSVFPLVHDYFENPEPLLAKRNMDFILKVIKGLEISTEIVYSSSLKCEEKSTDLLIEIIKKVEGDAYLAGAGAIKYQDDASFKKQKIELLFNNFKHPEYKQDNSTDFIPGLSIVDALMNVGFEGVKELLS